MKNIYHKTVPGNGLSVGIDEQGITISELTNIIGLIEQPETDWLVTTGQFSWEQYRNRESYYSGDNDSGKKVDRLVAGAISLLAYWGGNEEFIPRKADFERVE